MNKACLIAPVLALLALFLAATPSRATLEIALQETGVNKGAIHVVKSGKDFTDVSFTGTYGDFTIKNLGGVSDNGGTLSDLLSAATSVTNNSGTTKTLTIWITQTDYTLPSSTKLIVDSSLAGTVSKGTLGLKNIYQTYADKNNNAFGTSGFTDGLQSATKKGSTYDTGSPTGIFKPTAKHPYSLTSQITFTLSGKATANFSSQINVTGTPAPGGLVLAASAVAALALTRLRRRKPGFATPPTAIGSSPA
jgi:MYXO-CTERM domain-containing protein